MPSSKWWSGLSTSQKKSHIKKHPNSVYARAAAASVPGGKKNVKRVEPVHPMKPRRPKTRIEKIREWKANNPGKVKAIGLGLGLGLGALRYYKNHMND